MVGAVIPDLFGALVHSVPPTAVEIEREEAARAAREELSKQIYHQHEPGLLQRFLTWLTETLARFLSGAAGVLPGGWFGLVVLVALLVVVVLVIRWRIGPVARRRAGRGIENDMFEGRRRTAGEHRQAASEAAGTGDWNTAVREAFRGMVADLTERTVLEDRPGRTADETARELADRVPEVTAAARVFDEVSYGDREASEQAYATVLQADAAIRQVRVG